MLEQLPKILEESRKQVERLLNSPLKLKAQVSEVVYPNAKYGALFSSVMREDSALGEQCGSVADFLKKHRLSASGIPCFAKGTTDKVANLPQNERSEVSLENPQSSHSPTAKPATAVQGEAEAGFFRNLRILEAENRGESEISSPPPPVSA